MRIKNVIPPLMRIIFLIRIIQLSPKREIFSYLPRIEIVAYNFSKSKKDFCGKSGLIHGTMDRREERRLLA